MSEQTAMVYRETGGPDVIRAERLAVPEPGPGEVVVRMAVSGVNPTDWKARESGSSGALAEGWQIPNQDGAGRVTALGAGVDPALADARVWLFLAAYQRPWGTAAEYVSVPASRVAVLPDSAGFEVGAALGVPFLTAHRCLTAGESVPDRLAPGSLDGRTVLVQGGAGAVGNAAVQLAVWAGATVVSTVSNDAKAALARAAGSTHVVDYTREDVVERVRSVAKDGADVVVEVNAAANLEADAQLLARDGIVAVYAATGDEKLAVGIRPLMMVNARIQGVLLYTVNDAALRAAVEDVSAAVAAGAVRVGEEAGLPLHRYPLDRTGDAHTAVAEGAVGKVLITLE